jgi:diguanylate cyclase (GGDEF)-like protein
MPQPAEPLRSEPSAEDCFLDLLAETLEGLDDSVKGPFLQRFFKSFTQLELSETQSIDSWNRILARQREFSEALQRRIAMKTALVDVFGASHFVRVPVLLEYETYKKLQINAATDGLTGLYNRRLFDETTERELNRAKRYNQPFAVVLFDLRHLKAVNDQYGHMMGDQVLQLAAGILRKTLRASDSAFRIGGDEFALLLPQTDPEQASTLCRRVRSNFETDVAPLKIKVAAALDFGMAVYPQDGDRMEDLVQTADERLYALRYAAQPQPRGVQSGPSGVAGADVGGDATAATRETPSPRIMPGPGRESSPAPRETPPPPREAVPTVPESAPPSRETSPPVPEIPIPAPKEGAPKSVSPIAAPLSEPAPNPAPAPTPPPAPTATSAEADKAPTQPRKWERVSLGGTKSYAVIDGTQRTATVIDLSYGGVALLFDKTDGLPNEFSAVLHVPILPPLRVSLRKAYSQLLDGGRLRIGCAFLS